jgi:tetratricopeptide (TPR) repeat protein
MATSAITAPASQTDQPDGWGADEPGTVTTASVLAPSSPSPPHDCQDGWLTSPSTAKAHKVEDGSLSPVREQSARWSGEVEDDWLDEDEDDDDGADVDVDRGRAPAPGPDGRGRGILWALVAAVAVLLGFGFWSLREPPVPAVDKAAQAVELLQRGRLLVSEAKANLSKDSELAASQLGAAISSLKAGGAGVPEIRQTRLLQAQALVASGDYEEANALYLELLKVPEHRDQSRKALVALEQKLLERADDVLEDAEGSLKAGQFRLAETQGREALRLYSAFGGKASRKGMAYGAIGYANLNLARVSLAWENLSLAHQLYPQGNYHSVLASLQGGSAQPAQVVPESAPRTKTVVVDPSVRLESDYPTGGNVRVKKTAKTEKTTPIAETVSTNKTSQAKQQTNNVTRSSGASKETKRLRKDDSFDMTDRSKKT